MIKVSPSQISKSRECLRRWSFQYVQGIREPETESKALGTRVHAHLERYLRDGTPIDGTTPEGAIAQPGLVHLPPIGSGLIEHKFTLDRGDFSYHGLIDYLGPGLVIDHKTTSNFKYAKTPEELDTDPQGVIYAAAGGGDVRERWIYYRTKGKPASKVVEIQKTRGQVEGQLAELDAEVRGLITLRAAATLDLDPNPESCFSYGKPCPHLNACNLSPLQRFKRVMTKDDLLSQLRAKATGAIPVTTPAAGPAPMALPPAVAPAPLALPSAPAPMALPPAAPVAMSLPPPAAAPAPLALPVAAPAPMALPAPVAAPLPMPVAMPAPLPAPVAAEPTALPPPAALPANPAPKRRGRPPGSKNKAPAYLAPSVPVQQEIPAALIPPAMAAAAPVEPARDTQPAPAGKCIGTLYVNCAPMGESGTTIPATDLYRDAHAKVAGLGFAHYKLADFGKGPAMWALAVAEACGDLFDACEGYSYDLTVDSRTPEGSDCLETLCALADRVVRGI